MATVLAGAVLTIATATANIFGITNLSIQPTPFLSMESCTAYVKSQIVETPGWEVTTNDEPNRYLYQAIKKSFFSGVIITMECLPQG